MTRYLLAFIPLFFSQTSIAATIVFDIKNNKTLDSSLYTSQEGFVALDPLNVVYGLEVVLDSSLGFDEKTKVVGADLPEEDLSYLNKITEPQTTSDDNVIIPRAGSRPINTQIGNGQYRLVTGSFTTIVKDKEGLDRLRIEWKPEKNVVISQNCPPELFRMQELQNTQTTQPIGFYCNFQRSPGLVTISLPQGGRWLSSSLIEISGKGERFRTFEVPVGNLKGEASGNMRMNIGGRSLNYAVFVKKLDEKAENFFIPFEKTVAFGMISNSLATTSESFSSSSFFYEFNGLTDHIFKYFKIGLGFATSFAMSEDPKDISSRDSTVSFGYYSGNSSDLVWGVWMGHRNFDYKQDFSMTKFQSSQFGLGLNAKYTFSKLNTLIGYVEMANFGSKVVSSHMKFGLHYKRVLNFSKTRTTIGAMYEAQTMSVQTSTGDNRDLASSKMGLSLDF